MRVAEHLSFSEIDTLGPHYPTFQSLGAAEYWIMDEEGGEEPLIRSACPPFMLAPGYKVVQPTPGRTPRGYAATKDLPGFRPGTFGLSQLGYWEVHSRGGEGIIASFQCRPFHIQPDMEAENITGGRLRRMVTRGRHVFP